MRGGAPGDIAKRALETTGQVFRYAIAHGNFAGVTLPAEIRPSDVLKATRKVNYARIEGKELPNLLRAYRGLPRKTHYALRDEVDGVDICADWTELIEAKWEEIDTENARWNIPAERMKMRTPHIVPLAKQTLETLEMLEAPAAAITLNQQLAFSGRTQARGVR